MVALARRAPVCAVNLEQETRADESALLKARTFCAAWVAVEPYRKQRAGSKTQLRVEDKNHVCSASALVHVTIGYRSHKTHQPRNVILLNPRLI
jgi:hypothetical protein